MMDRIQHLECYIVDRKQFSGTKCNDQAFLMMVCPTHKFTTDLVDSKSSGSKLKKIRKVLVRRLQTKENSTEV